MSLDKTDTTAPFLNNLAKLIEDYKCTVIVVHHYRKPSEKRRFAHGAGEMAGSYALHGFGDFYITFKAHYRNRSKLTLVFEMRNCEEPPRMTVVRNNETLWYEFVGLTREMASKEQRKGEPENVADLIRSYGGEMENPALKAKLEQELKISDKTARNLIALAEIEGLIFPKNPNARPKIWRARGTV